MEGRVAECLARPESARKIQKVNEVLNVSEIGRFVNDVLLYSYMLQTSDAGKYEPPEITEPVKKYVSQYKMAVCDENTGQVYEGQPNTSSFVIAQDCDLNIKLTEIPEGVVFYIKDDAKEPIKVMVPKFEVDTDLLSKMMTEGYLVTSSDNKSAKLVDIL